MQEFACELGGKKRVFKYSRAERDLLEDFYDTDLHSVIYKKAYPTDERGQYTGGGRRKVQVKLIWCGVRHMGPAITESKVSEWLEELVKEKPDTGVLEPLMCAVAACWQSGVMGIVPKMLTAEEESEEGKAEG